MTGITDAQTLKQLESRLSVVSAERRELEYRASELNKKIGVLTNQQHAIRNEIKRLQDNAKDPIVSEHAQLRYLERVRGIDMAQVRAEILTPQIVNAIKTLGNGKFPSGTGFKALVRSNIIQTVEV